MLVRVEGECMWLDFGGRDQAVREAKMSVALDSAGGVPLNWPLSCREPLARLTAAAAR